MAKRFTEEQIDEMVALYNELGSYAAVARKVGSTAPTVSKYIKARKSVKTYDVCVEAQPIESISTESVIGFSNLSDLEKQSYKEWLKEFGR